MKNSLYLVGPLIALFSLALIFSLWTIDPFHETAKAPLTDFVEQLFGTVRAIWTFFVGGVGYVILFSMWARVVHLQKEQKVDVRAAFKGLFNGTNLNDWTNQKKDSIDLGLFSFALASILWSLAGVIVYFDLIFSLHKNYESFVTSLLAIVSVANSFFIALALPYVQIEKSTRKSIFMDYCQPSTLILSTLIIVTIIIATAFFDELKMVANMIELVFSISISVLVAYSLWLAFSSRKMYWERYFVLMAVFFAIATSLFSVLPVTSEEKLKIYFEMLGLIATLTYKTLFLFSFIQLGVSWEERTLNAINKDLEKQYSEKNQNVRVYLSELKAKIQHLEQQSFNLNTYTYSSQELDLSFYTKSEGSSQKVLALLRIPSFHYAIELDLNNQPAQLRKLFELAVQAKTQANYGYIVVEDGQGSFSHKQYSEFIKALTKYLPSKFVANLIEKDPTQTRTQIKLNIHPNNIVFLGLAKPIPTASEPNSFSRMLNYYGMSNN